MYATDLSPGAHTAAVSGGRIRVHVTWDDRAVERWIRDKYEKRLYAGASSERGAAETPAPSSAPAAVSAALRSAEPAPLIDFG